MSQQTERMFDRRLVDLLDTLRQHMPVLREQYRVSSLSVFGSYVRGEAQPDRDLDV